MSRKIFLLVILFGFIAVTGFAERTVESNAISIDTVWTLIAAFFVFFMQAGFAMVETGFTRAKNAANILMKNLMDFSLGSIGFLAVGFGLMFGADKLGLIGTDNFFLAAVNPLTTDGLQTLAFYLFQTVFAATAATIVSGAMAERTKFKVYLVYSIFITVLVYPLGGHWIWGDGFLARLGMVDFAGSTVVHSTGGWAGLVGAAMLAPRTGKYLKMGKTITVKAIPGHNIPLASLGVFILWFGWFGFNPGSTLSGTNLGIAVIAVTTNLAAAGGAIAAMVFTWIWFRKPDPTMTLNGALAGLVAITAGCAVVSPVSAIVIGLMAGVIVVLSVELFDKILYIDDPVGAISVHGVCGAFGTLAVGLFAQEKYSLASGLDPLNGFFYGGGLKLLGIQALGVITVFAWVTGICLLICYVMKRTMGFRVSREEELRGLDIDEHGIESYSGFQIFISQ